MGNGLTLAKAERMNPKPSCQVHLYRVNVLRCGMFLFCMLVDV